MNDFYVAVWADGTWCFWDELERYLDFMSDDYQKRLVPELSSDVDVEELAYRWANGRD